MTGPSKRLHARYPCEISAHVRAPAMKNKLFDAWILDVGMGGALLSVKGNATGPILHLVVAIDGKTADIKTRIARIVGMDRKRPKHYLYGVSFESDLSNSHHLKTIIDQARTGRWAAKTGTSDGEIRRNYWKL